MIKQDILLTVDNIVFSISKNKLHILLIKRAIEPFKDARAIPGWFVWDTETLDQAAYRELAEETNVKNAYLEQLYTFSDVDRDPRWRVVSCAYVALVREDRLSIKSGSDAKDAKLFAIDALPQLAFDHKKILNHALQRLKYKLESTNIAQYLLPPTFTLTELQKVYEIVLEQSIDVRNFRKKIDKICIVRETGEKVIRWAHRPAMLYEFVTKKLIEVNIL
jgi:8-oxo-dGTP diphosphatase